MEGTRIGSYRLTRKLGEGGMGAVYLAESESVATRKAVKVLLDKLSGNPAMMARFRFEAQAVADLQHDNIIGIDEFAQLPGGQWFIMMPFLEGAPLSSFLASHSPLGMHLTVHILAQVGAALHVAHSRGFVHRDLKPENVFLTSRHSNPHLVKVLDFGIAKNTHSSPDGHKTANGIMLGTPIFMAAEQYEDAARVDARADIFSLGVMAYMMLSRAYPFGPRPDNLMDLYNRQRYELPSPLPSHVPARAQDAVYRALAYDPRARPQSAQEFVIELALATPDDPLEPSGVEIVRQVASELLLTGPANETTRSPHAIELVRALWPRLSSSSTPGAGQVSHDHGGIPSAAPSRVTAAARPGSLATRTVPPHNQAAPVEAPGTTLSAASGPVPIAVAATPSPPRRLAPFVAAASAILVAGAVGVVLMVSRSKPEAGATLDALSPPSPPQTMAGATVDAATLAGSTGNLVDAATAPEGVDVGATVRSLSIDTEPSGAKLVIDGVPAGTAPVSIERALGTTIEIRAERRGYRPETRTFTIGRDTSRLEVALSPRSDAKDGRREKASPSSPPVAAPSPAATPAAPTTSPRPPPDGSTRGSTFNPDDVLGK